MFVDSMNIINSGSDFTRSDYEKMKIAESYRKLYEMSNVENSRRMKETYDKRVYNLSFKDLFDNFFTVWTAIINEMTVLVNDDSKNKDFRNYMIILSKDDRLLYIGLMMIVLSLMLYFIFFTS